VDVAYNGKRENVKDKSLALRCPACAAKDILILLSVYGTERIPRLTQILPGIKLFRLQGKYFADLCRHDKPSPRNLLSKLQKLLHHKPPSGAWIAIMYQQLLSLISLSGNFLLDKYLFFFYQ
jgi:hypothetical protein